MKKLIFIIIPCIMAIIGCLESCKQSMQDKTTTTNSTTIKGYTNLYTVEYDSCEYVVLEQSQHNGIGMGITHKGNCKYCNKR